MIARNVAAVRGLSEDAKERIRVATSSGLFCPPDARVTRRITVRGLMPLHMRRTGVLLRRVECLPIAFVSPRWPVDELVGPVGCRCNPPLRVQHVESNLKRKRQGLRTQIMLRCAHGTQAFPEPQVEERRGSTRPARGHPRGGIRRRVGGCSVGS